MTTITSEAGSRRDRSGTRRAAPPEAPAEVATAVAAALAENAGRRGPLLPVLHAVQHALGHVPDSAVPLIALGLNLSRADVHGVLTFYTDLRRTPAGTVTVQVCRAEACQASGSAELVTALQQRLQVTVGATRADGEVTLEEVLCVGNCALGPSVMLGGRCVGRLRGSAGAERVARLVEGMLTVAHTPEVGAAPAAGANPAAGATTEVGS